MGARRPVERPSWTSEGCLGLQDVLGARRPGMEAVLDRQEAHPEAALGARRPVRRVLGRQEANSIVKMHGFLASVP